MATGAFRVKYDVPKFLKNFRGDVNKFVSCISISMAKLMEIYVGRIKETKLGPQEWTPPEPLPPQSWAMAIVIAKKEGFTSFTRGSSGHNKIKELAPRMPLSRPSSPQSLWIQSGDLRKSIDWGVKVIDIRGRMLKRGPAQGNLQLTKGLIAVGQIVAGVHYAEDQESGKYPFAVPVVKESVSKGEAVRILELFIDKCYRSKN